MAAWLSSLLADDRYASLKLVQQNRGLPLDENDLEVAYPSFRLSSSG
jgi:hypothetical protein